MTRPDTLFEAASYDLNKFIERRIADRRAMQRDSTDRRKQSARHVPESDTSATADSSSGQSPAQH